MSNWHFAIVPKDNVDGYDDDEDGGNQEEDEQDVSRWKLGAIEKKQMIKTNIIDVVIDVAVSFNVHGTKKNRVENGNEEAQSR